jgi:hypothetical protein
MLKKAEPGEFTLERRDLPTSHFELLSQNIKFLFWPKGIDQSDVGHPSSKLPVMLMTNSLDRRPQLVGRNKNYRGSMCLPRHNLVEHRVAISDFGFRIENNKMQNETK